MAPGSLLTSGAIDEPGSGRQGQLRLAVGTSAVLTVSKFVGRFEGMRLAFPLADEFAATVEDAIPFLPGPMSKP